MKKSVALFAIMTMVVFTALDVSRAQAADKKIEATPPAVESKPNQSVQGKVSGVDTKAKTITVKDLILNISATTKIVAGKNPLRLDDIKVGQAVLVVYQPDDAGKLNAIVVYVSDKSPMPPANNKKKAEQK